MHGLRSKSRTDMVKDKVDRGVWTEPWLPPGGWYCTGTGDRRLHHCKDARRHLRVLEVVTKKGTDWYCEEHAREAGLIW